MFNVSFKVGEDRLAKALDNLSTLTDSFSVVPLNGEPQDNINSGKPVPLANFGEEKPVANFGIQTEEAKPAKKAKRRYKPRRKTFGTQRQRSAWLLLQIGTQPFKVSELMQQANGVGIDKTALYTVINDHIQRGQLRRLDKGLYERTGQSFSGSLGLAEMSMRRSAPFLPPNGSPPSPSASCVER